MRTFTEWIPMVMIFTCPAYLLPLILGPILLRRFKDDELSKMAGWFTLKPLLATPLWALIVDLEGRTRFYTTLDALPTLIPAIGLTLWIVWKYRHLLRTNLGTVILLLIGDALRWLNSFAWLTIDSSSGSPFYTAGLILPNAFAVMVLVIALLRKRRSLQVAPVRM
jgi:hypothetical protein